MRHGFGTSETISELAARFRKVPRVAASLRHVFGSFRKHQRACRAFSEVPGSTMQAYGTSSELSENTRQTAGGFRKLSGISCFKILQLLRVGMGNQCPCKDQRGIEKRKIIQNLVRQGKGDLGASQNNSLCTLLF